MTATFPRDPFFKHQAACLRAFTIVFLCLGLAACGERPDLGALALNDAPAPGARVTDIMIVTTRDKDATPDTYFGGERGQALGYAEASISVPPDHEPGQIEWPNSFPGDPEKNFVTRKAGYIADKASFTNEINRRLAAKPRDEREIFVFIHGYNTRFPEALYRFTQIIHDSEFSGVPVLFTWASRGKVQDYVYDLNSAAIARQALEQTLIQLSNTRAEKITILAHSMGNWLLMETAVQASPNDRRKMTRKIDEVILAAPDIDIDLFKAQLKKLGRPPKPYIVIVSRDDRALRLSRAIAGGKERVGAFSDDKELTELGAVVVDLTELDAQDGSHHSKFAQLAQFQPQLRKTLGQSSLTRSVNRGNAGTVGDDLGNLVGNTIALPVRIIAAPFNYAGGGT
ncbi:alpha/beta hydrolase [uncultured Roseibium sp.]|uniref:alpha/beta hydrolase n=1 Tax=uncultured Roseibium sp. TaxID=1936171 RepID=UPI0026284B1A|nr:alpha/beta hydrolase [uncultured Roseibium sp.]